MPSRSPKPARQRRVLLLWCLLVLVLILATVPAIFERPHFGMALHGTEIAVVDKGGPAARVGLSPGQRIRSVRGTSTNALPFLAEQLYAGSLGRSVPLTIEEAGEITPLIVTGEPRSRGEQLPDVTAALTGFGFLLIGLYAYLQLEGRLTVLFCMLCSGFSLALLPISRAEPAFMPILIGFVRALGALLLPPLALHFFLLFPRPRTITARAPWTLRLLYVPAVAGIAALLYVTFGAVFALPGARTVAERLEPMSGAHLLVYAVAALGSFVVGYGRVRSAVERRRYVVVLWGTLFGILPWLAVTLAHAVGSEPPRALEQLTPLGLLLVPLAFAYSIVRHRLFDIEVIVKRSAVFSLLTACLVGITIGVYAIFGRLLETLSGTRETWITLIAVVIIAGVFGPLRRRIEATVDRLFFPDRYDDRRMLRELGQALPGILKLEDLVKEVVAKLSRTLRVEEAALFFHDADGTSLPLAYASGLLWEDLALPDVPPRLRHMMESERRPLRTVDIEDRLPFGPLHPDEETLLSVFADGVFLPLLDNGLLIAVLAMGRRTGDEAYRLEDLDLLRAIGGQVTVGIRNARLHARALEKERLDKELKVARDIQRHLLPTRDPILTRLDISGSTSPCSEVGGDFYDYHRLSENRLGIAVGDVSGHGIPAAMIMASLSATLRAEADRSASAGELLTRLNARACEAFEPGQFVSLFYARIDPETMCVEYANAGHPPPFVVTRDGTVESFGIGGLLLGVDPDSHYVTRTRRCERGATLLLFTDGLVEAQRNDVEFGEAGILSAVRANGAGSADTLRRRILEDARRYVVGDPVDDVTLIVLRVV